MRSPSEARPAPALVMLALDGVDWNLLQELDEGGLTPFLSSLVGAGTWAPLDFPLPACADSGWTSAATGMQPDRHGILHPLTAIAGSLFMQAPGAAALRTEAIWHAADAAGRHTAVIGWPATRGLRLRHGTVIAPGADAAPANDEHAWPLDPQAVWPPEARELVHAARLAPGDIQAQDLHFLLAPLDAAARRRLAGAAAAALAECATLHALGTAAIEERGADVLMLRLPFLGVMAAALAGVPDRRAARLCLARCLQFLDLLCGRYQNLAGRDACFAILSNGTRDAGFMLLCGPGIARDRAIAPVAACDIWPTVAAALGLPAASELDGRVIDEALTAAPPRMKTDAAAVAPLAPAGIRVTPSSPALSAAALAMFEQEDLAPPDFAPQIAFARGVECETRLALATMTALRGNRGAALEQLRALGHRFGGDLNVRIALAEQLLLAGQFDQCLAITRNLPLVRTGGAWADATEGMVAFASGDWPQAMARLGALAQLQASSPGAVTPPINAAMWLGRAQLAQREWELAAASFRAAIAHDGRDYFAWSGLGMAERMLGQWRRAASAYGRAVSLGPRSAETLLDLATAWEHCGDMNLAAQARARAMRIDPKAVAGIARITTPK
ncbi:alkaline phosphatase family protein [Duganella violaceipulchra]|uniref:Alkaline phosphatase family protein n=1 Tax=Duganella violaceipulchra TaxID=2849652 RepID=A0AA41HBS6_9BURK|nr:alkaline phosphatase family protein [Duganella violaceicalia]MBV6320858.1 alkaline phosphatase family protein [Duganella violaceicalia]MCP2008431.1 tetratricopeptide (TPR) repeat protein [Duganella violaceicalia]